MAIAVTHGVADRLHLHAPGHPDEMAALAKDFDCGLVGETGATWNRRIALTNKQFTYFLAGIPAVLSDVPAHVAFAREAPGAAFIYRCEDPVSLSACLDALFQAPAGLAEARAQAYRLAQQRFNWEHDAQGFLACVSNALAQRERRSS